MPTQVVQINFNYAAPTNELLAALKATAGPISKVPGLVWKVWLLNEAKKEAGGIYLFDSEAAAQKYLSSEIVTGMTTNPAIRNPSVKQFRVEEELSRITRAPV